MLAVFRRGKSLCSSRTSENSESVVIWLKEVKSYSTEEICSVLEWKLHVTQRIIDRAIRGIFRVSYLLAQDNKYSFPDMSDYNVNISRLIVAYAFSNQSGTEEPLAGRGYIQVEFHQHIVEELRAASLLGMDWRRVTSLERQ